MTTKHEGRKANVWKASRVMGARVCVELLREGRKVGGEGGREGGKGIFFSLFFPRCVFFYFYLIISHAKQGREARNEIRKTFACRLVLAAGRRRKEEELRGKRGGGGGGGREGCRGCFCFLLLFLLLLLLLVRVVLGGLCAVNRGAERGGGGG